MSQVSRYIRKTKEGYAHWCPACKTSHIFYVDTPTHRGARWTFNGDVNNPTFSPSMNISVGPYPDDDEEAGRIDRCHYFLTQAKLQYLSDYTHELAGQTVDLPELPLHLQVYK
jgi:hypothetical protein